LCFRFHFLFSIAKNLLIFLLSKQSQAANSVLSQTHTYRTIQSVQILPLQACSSPLQTYFRTLLAFALIGYISRCLILLLSTPGMTVDLLFSAFAFSHIDLSSSPASTTLSFLPLYNDCPALNTHHRLLVRPRDRYCPLDCTNRGGLILVGPVA